MFILFLFRVLNSFVFEEVEYFIKEVTTHPYFILYYLESISAESKRIYIRTENRRSKIRKILIRKKEHWLLNTTTLTFTYLGRVGKYYSYISEEYNAPYSFFDGKIKNIKEEFLINIFKSIIFQMDHFIHHKKLILIEDDLNTFLSGNKLKILGLQLLPFSRLSFDFNGYLKGMEEFIRSILIKTTKNKEMANDLLTFIKYEYYKNIDETEFFKKYLGCPLLYPIKITGERIGNFSFLPIFNILHPVILYKNWQFELHFKIKCGELTFKVDILRDEERNIENAEEGFKILRGFYSEVVSKKELKIY